MRKFEECKICGGEIETALVVADPDETGFGDMTIVRCRECGLRFVPDIFDDDELSIVYAHHTPDYFDAQVESGTSARRVRLKVSILKRWVPSLEGLRVLDVGAGPGHFCHAVEQEGGEAVGVEPGADAVAYGRDRWGLNMIEAMLEEYAQDAHSERFDVITSWSVVEHLVHMRSIYDAARRLLKPYGRLVVAVPNPRRINRQLAWRRALREYRRTGLARGYNVHSRCHLQLADVSHLAILTEAADMEITDVYYTDMQYHPLRKDLRGRLKYVAKAFLLRLARAIGRPDLRAGVYVTQARPKQ